MVVFYISVRRTNTYYLTKTVVREWILEKLHFNKDVFTSKPIVGENLELVQFHKRASHLRKDLSFTCPTVPTVSSLTFTVFKV